MPDIQGWHISQLPNWRVDWIWSGYIARRNLTLLSSVPKVGKSTLLFHLFKAMKGNQDFLDQSTVSVPTVLLTEEPVPLLIQRRDEFELADAPLHVLPLQPGLSWPRCIAYVKRLAIQGYGLIVVDTLSRFWGIADENDAAQVIQALSPLFALTRTHNVGILGLHHTRKTAGAGGRAVRGSNALTGAVDVSIELERLHPYDKTPCRRLESISRYGETPDTQVIELTATGYHVTDAEAGATERELLKCVGARDGCTAADVAEEVMMSERNVQRVLTQLVARAILVRTGGGSGSSPYRYAVRADGQEER